MDQSALPDEPGARGESVPSGIAAVRADFDHFCTMHGARGWRARLWVLFASRSFWALALYRVGRSIYSRPRTPANFPARMFYRVAFEIVRFLTKTNINLHARIGPEVFIDPRGEVFITESRVGRGSIFCGGNTLGLGGRSGARGTPRIGDRVVLAPGASAVGPVEIPDDTVLGPNSLVGRSLPHGGFWSGIPPRPQKIPPERLIPGCRKAPPRRSRSTRQPGLHKPEPFWPALRADLERYLVYFPEASRLGKLRLLVTTEGAWASALYRFGRKLRTMPPPEPVATAAWALYRLGEVALGIVTSIYLDVDALIEPGFYIGHFVSVHVGAGVRIGRNSNVSQMCTIAGHDSDPLRTAPVLGERVYVGSGAKIIGPVRIGNGASISANSVVVADVPENGVVVGNPGVVISLRGSGDFIYLGGATGVRDTLPLDEARKRSA